MKKKLFIIAMLILVGGTSFYDLTHGTLSLFFSPVPATVQAKTLPKANPAPEQMTKTVTVQPGDTVLSIEEKLNPDASLSIINVIEDFKKLNPSVDPNHIQIGHSYKFKLYLKKSGS